MRYIMLWGVLLLTFASLAQDTLTNKNTIQSFDLQEATLYAEEHAYEVISTGYELQKAKKKIWETIAIGLPQVNVAANYNDNLELPPFMLSSLKMAGNKGGYIGQQYTSDASITATQLIFDGTYIVGLKASKVFYRLSEDKMEKVKESIREGVMQAYFYVLAAEKNCSTLQENLAASQKTYEEAKAYYEAGLREDTDADQAALAVSSIESKVNEAERSVVVARTTLKYLMGLDVNSKIQLKSSLNDLIAKSLISNRQSVEPDWSAHIDYRILETQHHAQKLMVKKEIASYLPSLSAFYRYGKNASSQEWNVFDKNTKWFSSSILGLKLKVPVFSSGMRHSKVVQERLALERIENKMTQKLQEMQQNKLLAENSLETAKSNYLIKKKSRDLAKKIHEKTKLKYTEGVSNSFELTQNEQQYLKAHSAYIGAMIVLLKADIAYEKALGIF